MSLFTKLNRLKNTLNGDLELPTQQKDQLSFGFEHFINQSIERGEQFDPRLLEDRLTCLKAFIDAMDSIPTGRTVRFENRYNGVTVRATKTDDLTFKVI